MISFEAENLNKGGYETVSVIVSGHHVLKISSQDALNGRKRIKETFILEPTNGDEIEVLVDGVKSTGSIFNVDGLAI